MRHSHPLPHRRAFTLVELLVVVGIITVLIALLLPALGAARHAANNTKCLATLRSMSDAAHMHAVEHKGYLPIAGMIGPSPLDATPGPLRDQARQKYMYYARGRDVRPLPLPVVLAHYMGEKYRNRPWNDFTDQQRFILSEPVVALLACPAQDPEAVVRETTISDGSWGSAFPARMGYLLNDALLSRWAYPWGEGPAGQLTRVRQPDRVFLFADGVARGGHSYIFKKYHPGYGISIVYGPEDTLYHYAGASHWIASARDSFDFPRHRGRVNVVFVDGHCETLMLPRPDNPIGPENPGDLEKVWISKGLMF